MMNYDKTDLLSNLIILLVGKKPMSELQLHKDIISALRKRQHLNNDSVMMLLAEATPDALATMLSQAERDLIACKDELKPSKIT